MLLPMDVLGDTIGILPTYSYQVSPTTLTRVAVQALEDQLELPGVMLVEAEACLGMLSRQKLFEILSRPFGIDVFLNRPIQALYETYPAGFNLVRLPAGTRVAQAVQIALGRPSEQRYEPLIVEFAGHAHRLLDVHVLLLAQSQLLARANHLIEQQVEIGQALSSTLELKEVFNLILDNMAMVMAYDRASILLRRGEALEFVATRETAAPTQGQPWPPSVRQHDLYRQICLTKQPALLSNPIASNYSPPQVSSCLGLPLIYTDEVIGMLLLERVAAEPYSPNGLPLAQAFAAQAAIALQNARLFDEVQRLAITDPLTRLYNRRHFFSLAQREFERAHRYGRPLSLLILDVDNFKAVNDTYGHLAGDQVLQTIASRCRTLVREIDLFARYGGEEFICLMPETSASEAQALAERLRQQVADVPIGVDGLQLPVTISLGVAGLEVTPPAPQLLNLIDRADQALYCAKRLGRNRLCLWSDESIERGANDYRYLTPSGEKPRLSPSAEAGPQLQPDWQTEALQAVPHGILITDRQGKILWANAAFTTLTGYDLAEVQGLTPRLFQSGQQSRTFYEHLWHTILTGKAWRGQVINRRKDDQLYLEELTITPGHGTNGEITHFVAVKHDITERERARDEAYRQAEANRQRLAELEAVNRVSSAMRAAQTLEELLRRLMDETLTILGSNAGAIWLYAASSGELRPAQARGWMIRLQESALQPGEGIVGRVFAANEPCLSREFVTDHRLSPAARAQIPPGWGGLCVPVRTAAETVGALCVAVPLPRQFAQPETRLLTTLAEMAGNAMHRMRLHAQTEQQLNRLTALRTIDLAIAGSRGLQATLELLLEQLTRLLGVDAAAVLMFDAGEQALHYAAGHGFHSRAIFQANVPLGESQAGHAASEQRLIQVADLRASASPPEFAAFVAEEGFIAYCVMPLSAKGQVTGVLEVFHRAALKPEADWLAYFETLGGQAAIAIDNARLFENLQQSNAELAQAYDATLENWNRMLDLRDHQTGGHSQRVVEVAVRLGEAIGLEAEARLHLRRGALLHDIGKMGTPDSILLKPGPLTEDEQRVMRRHPECAYAMLADIAFLRPALDVPYCHHEKWDGTGYPRGLKGDQIPLNARIFAVVDVWDALSSDRPYRPAWPPEKVQRYLQEQSGRHFDPAVVTAFLNLVALKEI